MGSTSQRRYNAVTVIDVIVQLAVIVKTSSSSIEYAVSKPLECSCNNRNVFLTGAPVTVYHSLFRGSTLPIQQAD